MCLWSIGRKISVSLLMSIEVHIPFAMSNFLPFGMKTFLCWQAVLLRIGPDLVFLCACMFCQSDLNFKVVKSKSAECSVVVARLL